MTSTEEMETALARCNANDLRYLIACGHVTLSSSPTLVSSDPAANGARRRMNDLVALGLAHTHRKTSAGRVSYEPTDLARQVAERLSRG